MKQNHKNCIEIIFGLFGTWYQLQSFDLQSHFSMSKIIWILFLFNVRYENKYTKRSSNTLLRLVYLFS